MRFALSALLVTALAGCNGKSNKTTPNPPPTQDAGQMAAVDAGSQAVSADAGPAPLSRDECQKFIDHVLGIVRTEHNTKVDPTVRPSDTQVTKIRTKLRTEDIRFCQRLPRRIYECALRARDRASYLACQPKPAAAADAAP